jgi:hypothetical protein
MSANQKIVFDALARERSALTNGERMKILEDVAAEMFDGHVTIMRFTTNWRVGFGTPNDRDDIRNMPVGYTFEEAARQALLQLNDKLWAEVIHPDQDGDPDEHGRRPAQ